MESLLGSLNYAVMQTNGIREVKHRKPVLINRLVHHAQLSSSVLEIWLTYSLQ